MPVLLCEYETLLGFLGVCDESDPAERVTFRGSYDFSESRIRVFLGPLLSIEEYDRVVEVPFLFSSGAVCMAEVEECWEPRFHVPAGWYSVSFALKIIGEQDDFGLEDVDFFFKPIDRPDFQSRILVAEPGLDPTIAFFDNREPCVSDEI